MSHSEPKETLMSESERLHFLNQIASTPAGLKFLRWLCHEICTYHDTSATLELGKSSLNACLFNEGRKDIWRSIRPYLTMENLGKIDGFDVFKEHERILNLELEEAPQVYEDDEE